MKKKYLISILIVTVLGILLVLSFIKLPVSVITKDRVAELSNSKLQLSSFNKQYFKLLPAPYVTLNESIFNLSYNEVISEIATNRIEISRSLFDSDHYSIAINQGFIKNPDFNFKNLEFNISKDLKNFSIRTNRFLLDESEIQLDILVQNNFLNSISYFAKDLKLKKIYDFISAYTKIDLSLINKNFIRDQVTIDAQGIYETNELIINSAEIKISENSSIKISGIINFNDPYLSSIEIKLNNIDSNFIKENIKKSKLTDLIFSILPIGKIESSEFVIEDGLINLKSMDYISNANNKFSIKSLGPIGDISKPNLELLIKINDFLEFKSLISKLPINNIDHLMDITNINKGYLDLLIENNILEINQADLETLEQEKIFLKGDYNINNQSFGDIKIELEGISQSKIQKIIQIYKDVSENKYLKLIKFDKINVSMNLSPQDNLVLVTRLELMENNNITSSAEGLYQNMNFAGSFDFKNLDLKLIDSLFLNTERLEGSMNLEFETNGLINIENIQNTEGFINGNANIKIENNEIVLLSFLQSLATDVNDLETFNAFIQILTKSFMNKSIKYQGNVINSQLNEFIINDFVFLAPDGEEIKSNIVIKGKDFELTVIDIFNDEDLILSRINNKYSFKRKNARGVITKPVEELIKKNLNQLFENLLN
tara:strand:+ start:1572 stop:3545 length:1974 start_codon:yes stop_codon:yes gene_type:complete